MRWADPLLTLFRPDELLEGQDCDPTVEKRESAGRRRLEKTGADLDGAQLERT